MIILLVSSKYKIGDYTKVNSESEKLLDVKLEVNFYDHISDLCEKKKASRKICAWARITRFMGFSKINSLMNAFFTSQLSYYPLISMCHNDSNNRKINIVLERCLSMICNDKQLSLTELLDKDSSVQIHITNIQKLEIEMLRFCDG